MKLSPYPHQVHEQLPIWTPRRCDILCGPGKFVFNHPGNVRFRRMVEQRSKDYDAASKALKTRVVQTILSEVRATGARLLRKHPIYAWWNVVEDDGSLKSLRDKTTHCLRLCLTKNRSPDASHSSRTHASSPGMETHHDVQGGQQDDGKFLQIKGVDIPRRRTTT